MRRSLLPRGLVVLLLAGAALLITGQAHAYSWMIKHGFSKCSSCHVDPSGGETLTGMGRVQSDHLMSIGGDSMVTLEDTSEFGFGFVPEPAGVRLGGSYRHFMLYRPPEGQTESSFTNFPMQADLYGAAIFDRFFLGASLGVAKGIAGTAHVRGAQLNREAGDGFVLLSRNHYLGLWLFDQTLLRVGRMNLPFGIRVPEHILWARESTRTDRESDQQHGVSLTYERGPWRVEGMFVLGNFQLNPDRFRERGVSGSLEYLLEPTLAVGGSLLLTRSEQDRLTSIEDAVRYAAGGHLRWGISSQLALLAELDLLKEAESGLGHTGFARLDYEPLRGVHLQLTGELLDEGLPEGGDLEAFPGKGQTRLGGWATMSVFVIPHVDVRFDAIKRQDDRPSYQAQLHLYL